MKKPNEQRCITAQVVSLEESGSTIEQQSQQ